MLFALLLPVFVVFMIAEVTLWGVCWVVKGKIPPGDVILTDRVMKLFDLPDYVKDGRWPEQ